MGAESKTLPQKYVICIAIGITVLAFLCGYLFGRRNGIPTSSTVQSAKQEITNAGNSVAQSQDQVREVEKQLSSTVATIRGSRETTNRIANETDECIKLIDECIKLNSEARGILEGAGATDK